jgi:hypothetical protein
VQVVPATVVGEGVSCTRYSIFLSLNLSLNQKKGKGHLWQRLCVMVDTSHWKVVQSCWCHPTRSCIQLFPFVRLFFCVPSALCSRQSWSRVLDLQCSPVDGVNTTTCASECDRASTCLVGTEVPKWVHCPIVHIHAHCDSWRSTIDSMQYSSISCQDLRLHMLSLQLDCDALLWNICACVYTEIQRGLVKIQKPLINIHNSYM